MLSVYNKTQKMKEEARKKLAKYHELRKQRGMSLLEVIIVLGIIGTIAAGVVVLAQRAFDSRAITELVSNTNTIRVAMKDAYQRNGVYPDYQSPISLTADTIKNPGTNLPAIAQLVQLGKLTADEGRNNISGDFVGVAGIVTSDNVTAKKAFAIELNGLSQDQCRSILGQVGNNWEYVEVGTSASGQYNLGTARNMSSEVSNTILRSLADGGQDALTADKILGTCTATTNSIILGSR
ncbi:type IV pilus major pilin [Escherichia coli]|uniref:Toxin-coregulated pilus subunit CofA n=1 Tax=Escherichia coli O169:H41 TaxID=1446701 RepID=A0A0S3PMT3_ECOLX|nr:type IV pilus major pilin [Escherichia coli]EAB0838362.1 type IV pilus major pilin [Escherichia coli]EEW4124244.1 type IV pilus major pilin [Escherichia coli]EEW4134599.1 type IV pilus major pilin [Escherichia coli]EEW4139511.1 type IV pilus major pilin [Escherichia coli]EEW4144158.1 type IV pilus major pilin [Escherichia coli]